MSRTTPLAVRRRGGIRAEEPTGSGMSLLFGSEDIWRGAGVVRLFCFVRGLNMGDLLVKSIQNLPNASSRSLCV